MLQNTRHDSGRCSSSSAASSGALREGSASTTTCLIGGAWAAPWTLTSAGSRSVALASARIVSGKVAENSRVWHPAGTCRATSRIWSSKPMSSMRSASSSTKVSTPASCRAPWPMSSRMRPGVPTTTCGAWLSDASCGASGIPPHSTDSFTLGTPVASLRSCSPTCSASSRVGHSTSAWVRTAVASSRCSRPRPKAAVLPLPVGAWAMRSRPSRIGGRACACTGVMAV